MVPRPAVTELPTDDHNSELNALDLVSPPSSDRHFGGDGSGTGCVWVSYDIDLYLWSGANLSMLLHMNRLSRRDGEGKTLGPGWLPFQALPNKIFDTDDDGVSTIRRFGTE